MLDHAPVGPEAGVRDRDSNDVPHQPAERLAQPATVDERAVERGAEHVGVERPVGLLHRPVEDRAHEARRLVLDVLEEDEVAVGQSPRVVTRARLDGHAQEVRILTELRPQGVRVADPRSLPLAPGTVRAAPPPDGRGPRVGRRQGRRLDQPTERRRGLDGLRRLRRLGGLGPRLRARRGESAPRRGGHHRPAEGPGDVRLELLPALLVEGAPVMDEDHEVLERLHQILGLLHVDGAALGERPREREPQIPGPRLALDERRERLVVEMREAEHAVEHADRALDEGGRLFRVAGGWRGPLGRRDRLRRSPDHLAEPSGLREALELVEPAVDVVHGLDPTGDVPRRLGHQDLPGLGGRADARRQVHHAAEVVAALLDRLARVDPDADRDPGARVVPIRRLDRALDRDRAEDGAAGRREGDHEAVTLGLHDRPAECLDLLADDGVVLAQDPVRGLVAELLRVVREPADVAEEDRDRAPERHRGPGGVLRALRPSLHAHFVSHAP